LKKTSDLKGFTKYPQHCKSILKNNCDFLSRVAGPTVSSYSLVGKIWLLKKNKNLQETGKFDILPPVAFDLVG
jgi:hypothetical protein